MRKQLIVKMASVIVMSALVIFSFGQGCGKMIALNGGSEDAAGSSGTPGPGDPGYNPNTRTLALVYGKQILDHYTSCFGSGIPSARTLAMYESKKGTISETGEVASLTAPGLMAAASIAGEVCEDLIQLEAAAPRILVGINLSSTALPTQGLMEDAMRRIARSCWSRDEDSVEKQIVMNAINQSFSSGPTANKAHDAALFLCTSMLGSLDALVL